MRLAVRLASLLTFCVGAVIVFFLLRIGLSIGAGIIALFAIICVYRLEVHPNLYIDEMAYLRAARMFAGQVEVGRILGRGVPVT